MKKKVKKVSKENLEAIKLFREKGIVIVPNIEIPSRFDLYKRLKEAQYPQGGGGQYMLDPDSNQKVYVPTYQELLTHYVSDPKGWEVMVDTITKVWIDNKNGKQTN